ncbi:hypothetical protein LTR53_007998 [Teratosphaeriaceae sp. CCFEE 6253]|nr:hypothetical protein LTR53_007998 [Teratosphaeriaceae sp. CCFEE 6253]
MATQHDGLSRGRRFPELIESYRASFTSMEKSADLIILLTYCMTMYAPVRICVEAGVFRRLSASPHPLSADELAKSIEGIPQPASAHESAEREEFLGRMIRAVCALNLIDEAGARGYAANELTETLADPGFEAGFVMLFANTFGPSSVTNSLFEWAKDHAYTAPTTSTDGPVQQAHGFPGKTTFQFWVHDEPSYMSNLSALMKRIQQDRLNWSAWFPANILFTATEPGEGRAFMVDVGGGLGHDLAGFAGRYPDKSIRLVLQEQPEVIQEAKEQDLDSRIELSEHDFFAPQPVKGANIVSNLYLCRALEYLARLAGEELL